MAAFLRCVTCQESLDLDALAYQCRCGSLLEVAYDSDQWVDFGREKIDNRRTTQNRLDQSGVWRFREGLGAFNDSSIVSLPEGNTPIFFSESLAHYAGLIDLKFKHEGYNPSGSFKDRGMSVAISQAKKLGITTVGCASTGNTSASLAAFAAHAGLKSVVFLPAGKVSLSKIAQAVGYGAQCVAIKGDFDDAMKMVQEIAREGLLYLVNSINPFRLEGQKTIIWEMLQDLNWDPPDWIVVPGGNLGNTSAFGKALREAYAMGWIANLPRLATIQAAGASPFYKSYKDGFASLKPEKAETIATAVRIGNPVNFIKARAEISATRGVVESVTDAEIMTAKRAIDRAGIGCEPSSACSLAGAKKLRDQGIIKKTERVVAVLTGHMLKDTEAILADGVASKILEVEADSSKVKGLLR